jgi:hypothetical protein
MMAPSTETHSHPNPPLYPNFTASPLITTNVPPRLGGISAKHPHRFRPADSSSPGAFGVQAILLLNSDRFHFIDTSFMADETLPLDLFIS